jgi:hypothetical protein
MDEGDLHEQFLHDIEIWLASLRTTTWGGQGWDVTDPKERREAANWLADTIYKLDGVASYR